MAGIYYSGKNCVLPYVSYNTCMQLQPFVSAPTVRMSYVRTHSSYHVGLCHNSAVHLAGSVASFEYHRLASSTCGIKSPPVPPTRGNRRRAANISVHNTMPPERTVLDSITGNQAFNCQSSPYQRGRIIGLTESGIKSGDIQDLLKVVALRLVAKTYWMPLQ